MYEVILMREKNRKQTRLLVATLIVIPIGILVLFTVLFFTNKMEEEMHTQLVQNLKDVAHQSWCLTRIRQRRLCSIRGLWRNMD